MRKKHRKTLAMILDKPTRSGIRWADIESLIRACGGEIEERAGSRMGIWLNGVRANVHRPHPMKEVNRATVKSIRRFLTEAGVYEDDVQGISREGGA